ncbi:MAG TPA: PaaI family thioesterase [Acidimicrobiia bacterium]|nr:PaaI family thioesterase [Acidimicrobiia bacterium]
MAAAYPPDRHLLRDLRLEFDHSDESDSRAWLPIVPELCAGDGIVRAGALETLVDVIGGGLAATAAQPDWIATADLTLHVVGAATSGSVEARARVVHAGRTTVVIEVELYDHADREIGLATMSFARLPRRDENPDIGTSRSDGPSTMALPTSRLDAPLVDMLGARVVDAARGELEVPVGEWTLNSLGAMQGGAVATVIDAAAEAAIRSATSERLVVTDLQVTYLALGRVGPIRTSVEVLGVSAGHARARVELVDAGAESRVTTLARVVATGSLRDPR